MEAVLAAPAGLAMATSTPAIMNAAANASQVLQLPNPLPYLGVIKPAPPSA
jgi:hypothetical protein